MDRTVVAGALSSSIAHELRQPLGAILSNAEAAEALIAKRRLPSDQLKDILADIRRDDQRAAAIIAKLSGLLKTSDLQAQDVNVNNVILEVLRIIKPEADSRGITLDDYEGLEPILVRADPVHLQQVFLNLSMNAWTRCDPANSAFFRFRSAVLDDFKVLISVVDTGAGIPDAELEAIFGLQVSTRLEGSGLGLFISRMIVQTYGGKIWAENRPNGGAILRIVLPLSRGPSATPADAVRCLVGSRMKPGSPSSE